MSSVRPSLPDRPAGGDERAVRLRAHGLGRLLVHRDLLRRLDELETLRVEAGGTKEDRLDLGGGRFGRACDDFIRGAIATECVDSDADHEATRKGFAAARSRDRRRSCRSGTCGAAASASRTGGTGSAAAPRSGAWRGACHGVTWRFSSSGRPRRRSIARGQRATSRVAPKRSSRRRSWVTRTTVPV